MLSVNACLVKIDQLIDGKNDLGNMINNKEML